tara:strand:- start:837 stop:1256 length:420 start_codon:yes stop_codon:yes gene_type:complete
MQDRVMAGTYSNLKIIQTRRVFQMIIEFPIEAQKEFTDAFGLPMPDAEQYVAVARLKQIETSPPTATKLIQQAGILCKESAFGEFLRDKYNMEDIDPQNPDTIADAVRALCGIKSRTEFNTDKVAAVTFERLVAEYQNK